MKKIKKTIDAFLYRKLYKKWYLLGIENGMILDKQADYRRTMFVNAIKESRADMHTFNVQMVYSDPDGYEGIKDFIHGQLLRDLIKSMLPELSRYVVVSNEKDALGETMICRARLDVWLKEDDHAKT